MAPIRIPTAKIKPSVGPLPRPETGSSLRRGEVGKRSVVGIVANFNAHVIEATCTSAATHSTLM